MVHFTSASIDTVWEILDWHCPGRRHDASANVNIAALRQAPPNPYTPSLVWRNCHSPQFSALIAIEVSAHFRATACQGLGFEVCLELRRSSGGEREIARGSGTWGLKVPLRSLRLLRTRDLRAGWGLQWGFWVVSRQPCAVLAPHGAEGR